MNHELKKHTRNKNPGFSLVEIVIYIGILGAISIFIANFLIHIVGVYQRSRAEREVISNGRLLLETVEKNISQASEVYTPTSRFNIDTGQLSIITLATSTPEHSASFIDFWIDNGRFWMRQEGGSNIPISASSVRISKFRVERIVQGLGHDAIKATIQVDSASKFSSSVSLNLTSALRGNY